MRHCLGTCYDIPGEERYILAHVDYRVAALINLRDGNRFNDPVRVKLELEVPKPDEKTDYERSYCYITEDDFIKVTGHKDRKFFKKVKKQAI